MQVANVGMHGKGFYCKIKKDPRPRTTRRCQSVTSAHVSTCINVFVLPLVLLRPIKFSDSIQDAKQSVPPGWRVSESFPLNTSDLPTSTDQQPGLKVRDKISPDAWVLVKEKAFPGAIAKKTHSQVQQ